jgi:quinol monooxygenase YgiN
VSVLEVAHLTIKEGESQRFADLFATASQYICDAEGCLKVDWHPSVEHAHHFLLLVEWRSLEDHVERFVSSPEFGKFQDAISDLLAEPPVVEHFHL